MATTHWQLGMFLLTVSSVATTARLVTAQTCDFQRCLNILKRPIACGSSSEFINCAVRGALQNSACDENIKDQAQMLILNAEEFQEEHCQGPNAFPVCPHQTCVNMLTSQHRTCGAVREGIQCVEMQVLQNPECPAGVKTQTRALAQEGHQYLAQNCPGPSNPAASHVQLPTAASPPANPPQSPVPNLPIVQPGMCEYLQCIDILTTQQVTCRTLSQARQCFQIHVQGSAACPPPVTNDIRNQLQQEEHYLHCRPEVYIAASTTTMKTTTTTTAIPAAARPPPTGRECVYQDCFSLVEQFDLTCSIASVLMDCSQLLSQNPSCSIDIKNEALNYMLMGQEFLRDQCEELFPFARK